MGVYDTYWNANNSLGVQIKAGSCCLEDYAEGSAADHALNDGAYFAPEGVVVIRNGIVVKVTENAAEVAKSARGLPVFTKWGEPFDPLTEDIEALNPIVLALRALDAQKR